MKNAETKQKSTSRRTSRTSRRTIKNNVSSGKDRFVWVHKQFSLIFSCVSYRISCPECGIVINRQSYKRHKEAIHLKLKRFRCDLCNKEFGKRCIIVDHMNVRIFWILRRNVFLTVNSIRSHMPVSKTFPVKNVIWNFHLEQPSQLTPKWSTKKGMRDSVRSVEGHFQRELISKITLDQNILVIQIILIEV